MMPDPFNDARPSTIMYVWSHINCSRSSVDQPGKVPNPARGQLNSRKDEYFSVRARA